MSELNIKNTINSIKAYLNLYMLLNTCYICMAFHPHGSASALSKSLRKMKFKKSESKMKDLFFVRSIPDVMNDFGHSVHLYGLSLECMRIVCFFKEPRNH